MRIPKYRRQTARDYAFVEWRGKRHRLPGKFNSAVSRDAYDRFIAENVLRRPAAPRKPGPGEFLSCRLLVELFLAWAKSYYPGRGGRGEYWNLWTALTAERPDQRDRDKDRKAFLEFFGDTWADEFGPLRLKELQQNLIDLGQSRSWINKQCASVVRMFKWAVSEQLVRPEVHLALTTVGSLSAGKTAARETDPRRPVSWEDVRTTLTYLKQPVRSMVEFQWYTGARSDSICRAKPEQFDRSESVWLWRPRHKSEHHGKELVVPIGPKCQAVLLPFLKTTADDAYLFNPQSFSKSSRYRDHYDTNTYRQSIVRAQKRAAGDNRNVVYWTPHQIRHTKATELAKQHGVEAARILLGHESLNITAIYAERDLEAAKKIAGQSG